MRNLFKAFLFKLRKDLTFRITLFIGLGIAVLMTLIYLGIDLGLKALAQEAEENYKFSFCTGHNLFISSLSPAQNFGIAIPVNLISFTVLEFTHGTIRNKIITGNSKSKIYFSLILAGLVFTFALIVSYSLLCLALGSIIGGFDINGSLLLGGTLNAEYFVKLIVLTIMAYILITVTTIFFATLLRNIGPCIPIVILLILGCYLVSTIFGAVSVLGDSVDFIKNMTQVLKYVNPLHSIAASSTNEEGLLVIANDAFIAEIVNNVIYSAIFLFFGLLIFKKRDVK